MRGGYLSCLTRFVSLHSSFGVAKKNRQQKPMEFSWSILLLSLAICLIIRPLLSLLFSTNSSDPRLPPGPPHFPIITSFLWLRKSFSEIEPVLRTLHAKYGPMVTLRIGSRPVIFVADRNLAHQALIQNGALFSDRPRSPPTNKILNSNQHTITSAAYGPTWRVLRRNLASEMLHPLRVKSFSRIRKWVLEVLLERLKSDSNTSDSVRVVDHLRYAMFCVLVFMCFGERVDDKKIRDIERVQRHLLLSLDRFSVLNFWPTLSRLLFRKSWEELLQLRKDQEAVYVPIIRARKQVKENRLSKDREDKDLASDQFAFSYVDTLLDLQLPEGKRKLDEGEVVTLCSEFLDAGTDTTATALQWIMANLVKYPQVQQKLVDEIGEVMADNREDKDKEVREEDLQKLPYLKAVILEGLRRHPPGHFVLPHAVSEDVAFNDYLVPKNVVINFMVAEMGWDSKIWEEPMAFKPERFLNNENGGVEAFDITGSKEIRMMPFGAGRRICPGYNLAILHLEYFVANLVWNFEWKASKVSDVDLSERQEFTVVMKNPLQARISPRS